MKILVADDELKIRETIYDYMTFKGMEVDLATNGQEAVDMAYTNPYDLIMLDVMMPVMDGIEACKQIRQELNVPVFFLSALGEEENLLGGFNVGADDYMVKPFSLAVLYQKIQSMVTRYRGAGADNSLTVSGITIDFNSMKVSADGKEIALTDKDIKMLGYLMKNKGQIVNRDQILTNVWGYDFEGDSRVVDTHIKRIRKSLGHKKNVIKTVINRGYMFVEE